MAVEAVAGTAERRLRATITERVYVSSALPQPHSTSSTNVPSTAAQFLTSGAMACARSRIKLQTDRGISSNRAGSTCCRRVNKLSVGL